MTTVEEIVNENINLARYVTKQIYDGIAPKGLFEYEDLFQEASIGLVKAAKTYDPQKGYRFSTYSSTCMRNQILMYVRKMRKFQMMVFLDTPIGFEDKENITLTDTLESREGNPEEMLLAKELTNVIKHYPIPRQHSKHMSKREERIFALMCKGYRQCEIVGMVGCSQRMASTHQTMIRKQVREVWLN